MKLSFSILLLSIQIMANKYISTGRNLQFEFSSSVIRMLLYRGIRIMSTTIDKTRRGPFFQVRQCEQLARVRLV
jgi:hypothetical protein